MTSATGDEGAAIAAAHNVSGYRRIVDVGGGHGALLAAVLNRYPSPSGVLFDLSDAVETACGAINRHFAAGRVEKVPGDFSDAVPAGGDAYLLKWIVHDWDDEAAIRILTTAEQPWRRLAKSFSSRSLFPQARLVPRPPAWTP
jgi:O-methyltransferase domain